VRECGARPCPLAMPPHASHYACNPSETRIGCEPLLATAISLFIKSKILFIKTIANIDF